MIIYFQWINFEKRERRVIDGEEDNLNAGNSMDCADKSVSDDAADELIVTDINAGDLIFFSEDASGGSVATINARNSKNCADILIKNDAEDVLIATTTDAEKFEGLC